MMSPLIPKFLREDLREFLHTAHIHGIEHTLARATFVCFFSRKIVKCPRPTSIDDGGTATTNNVNRTVDSSRGISGQSTTTVLLEALFASIRPADDAPPSRYIGRQRNSSIRHARLTAAGASNTKLDEPVVPIRQP